ncbi:MAG: NfeD family protein [Prolixibacteraceae bacterium]|jgi:membrane-bound ClpP family serine protease|nr:NfeD family protein [Prolixibacteraceae bacterium]
MDILVILFLVFLGIVLLLIEFTILPGVTIAGIGGLLMMGAAVYLAFKSYGTVAGIIALVFVLIVSPVLVYRMFKTRMGKKMMLESKITGTSTEIKAETIKIGDEGIAISRLAPIGKVRIGTETVEAKSTGSFIDQQTKVKVVGILRTQIIVEPIN